MVAIPDRAPYVTTFSVKDAQGIWKPVGTLTFLPDGLHMPIQRARRPY